MASNTISFIDQQINQIESELKNNENALERFRSTNLLVNLGAEADQILSQLTDLEAQKAKMTLEQSLYDLVLDFLEQENGSSGIYLPSFDAVQQPVIQQLIKELIESSSTLENLNSVSNLTTPHY